MVVVEWLLASLCAARRAAACGTMSYMYSTAPLEFREYRTLAAAAVADWIYWDYTVSP